MKITVDVAEEKVERLIRQRIDELFSEDARYRDTEARGLIRRIVDESAVSAVRAARDSIASELPKLAAVAVRAAVHDDIEKAAKRGLSALRKLYVGFDPSKLTPEQRAWLETQITTSAKTEVKE